jgi:hypothetical protein
MSSKPKKIIIVILIILVVVVLFLVISKKPKEEPNLVSSSPVVPIEGATAGIVQDSVAQDFLTDLLNVKSIQLDDAIFSDPAFATLRDSTIVLVQDGNEGRPNPFAPIGSDIYTSTSTLTPTTTTPVSTTPTTTVAPITTTPVTTPTPVGPTAPTPPMAPSN